MLIPRCQKQKVTGTPSQLICFTGRALAKGWAALLSSGKDHWDCVWTQTAKPELEHLRQDQEWEKKARKGGALSTSDLQARNKTILQEARNEGGTQRSHHIPTLDLLSNENNSWENTVCAFLINNMYTSLKGKHGHWFVTTLSSSRACTSRHSNHFLI